MKLRKHKPNNTGFGRLTNRSPKRHARFTHALTVLQPALLKYRSGPLLSTL
jgi:hypothetical protein